MKKGWTLIYSTFKVYKMRIIQAKLEQSNIQFSTINKKDTITQIAGEIELYVHEKDALAAKKIIEKTSFENRTE